MISEEELELIHWRATRGSHYAGTYIQGSKYARQVVEEDVPRLLMEIHLLQKQINSNGAGEPDEARLRRTAQNLLDFHEKYGAQEFTRRFGTKDLSRAEFLDFLQDFLREGEPHKPSDVGK